jgi:hypothetical protein
MMAEIVTRYSIGDVVFRAGTQSSTKRHPCPDCLGTKTWKATSPGGGEYTFGCPRCGGGYSSRGNDLEYSVIVPLVTQLTIGSVRYDSHGHWGDGTRQTQYMARETGVGGGSVYDETDLYPTREEAQAAAEIKAAHETVTTPWVVERYSKSLSISDYQLNVVGFEEQKRKHEELQAKASSLRYAVGDAVEYMNGEKPDEYDFKWAVDYLRKGLAKFTGEEVGGVSPDDEPAEEPAHA